MVTYILLSLVSVILLVVLLKVTALERNENELRDVIIRMVEDVMSLKLDSEDRKHYAVCVCQKPNKQRSYFAFTADDFEQSRPTAQELDALRQNVLKEHPEFNSCEIIFFGKIAG